MSKTGKRTIYYSTPLEREEQTALFEWAKLQTGKFPELELMYHVPNEGKRTYATGRSLIRQGLKKGVPDICLPVPRCGCHGMYIEMKRLKSGRISKEQQWWLNKLTDCGYYAVVCYSWEDAAHEILNYLQARETERGK